jgi:hypothetical protein
MADVEDLALGLAKALGIAKGDRVDACVSE